MDNIPLNMIAFGFADRFLEPFCYGCAAYVVTLRLTKSSFAKIAAIMAGVLMFLWMDDIWPRLGFEQGRVGVAAGNPDVAEMLTATTRKLGAARFNTGETSGLFGLKYLDSWDILSALLFVPLGFLMGLRLSRRKWDETQFSHASNIHQPQRSLADSLSGIQSKQISLIQKGDDPMRIHIRTKNQEEQVLKLEQVNNMLNQGELDGDEPAWAPGLSEWTRLESIKGVFLPAPPPFIDESLPETPPPFPGELKDMSTDNAAPEFTDQTQTRDFTGPKGIGGWLAFFCVSIVILGPLVSFGQFASGWEQSSVAFDRFPSLKNAIYFEMIGYAIIIIYGIIVGCKIWGGEMAGKRLAKQYLKIRLLSIISIEIITLGFMLNLPSQIVVAATSSIIGAVFRECVFFLIWWMYFKKSKRVRNTYESI